MQYWVITLRMAVPKSYPNLQETRYRQEINLFCFKLLRFLRCSLRSITKLNLTKADFLEAAPHLFGKDTLMWSQCREGAFLIHSTKKRWTKHLSVRREKKVQRGRCETKGKGKPSERGPLPANGTPPPCGLSKSSVNWTSTLLNAE